MPRVPFCRKQTPSVRGEPSYLSNQTLFFTKMFQFHFYALKKHGTVLSEIINKCRLPSAFALYLQIFDVKWKESIPNTRGQNNKSQNRKYHNHAKNSLHGSHFIVYQYVVTLKDATLLKRLNTQLKAPMGMHKDMRKTYAALWATRATVPKSTN